MSVRTKSPWVVVVAGCAAVMLSGFLCGCNSGHVAIDAVACNDRGVVHFKAGRHAEAIAAYKEAIAIKPDYARAYCNMGNAYCMLEQSVVALAAFKKSIAIEPDDAEAYGGMGAAYGHLGQFAEAIAAFKKSIAIKPYAEAYGGMGAAYDELGQYDEAIATFKKAIAIKPDYAEAYHTRAIAHYCRRNYDKAWADVKACRKLGYRVPPEFLAKLREASARED